GVTRCQFTFNRGTSCHTHSHRSLHPNVSTVALPAAAAANWQMIRKSASALNTPLLTSPSSPMATSSSASLPIATNSPPPWASTTPSPNSTNSSLLTLSPLVAPPSSPTSPICFFAPFPSFTPNLTPIPKSNPSKLTSI